MSEERDEDTRTQRALLRYERRGDDGNTGVERPWLPHWYTLAGFQELAAAAGLITASVSGADGGAAREDATSMSFRLQAADRFKARP